MLLLGSQESLIVLVLIILLIKKQWFYECTQRWYTADGKTYIFNGHSIFRCIFSQVFYISIFRELTSKYKIERLEYSNVSIFQLLYFLTKNYQLFPSPLYHLSLNKIGQHKL